MRKRRSPGKAPTARTAAHKGDPAFILAADDHVRNEAPQCRMDNYVEAVFKKLDFRNSIAKKYKIPILQAGDLGDKSYFVKKENEKDKQIGWTAEIYNRYVDIMTQNNYPGPQEPFLFCVGGNHDLHGHDIQNLNKSVLYGLINSNAVKLLNEDPIDICNCNVYGCSWDEEIPEYRNNDNMNILVIHKMIINQLPLWPGQEAPKAVDILKQNTNYDLIVSGDNHNTFIAEYDQRILVNPGSMMRSTTKQFDHKPCFFLYYPESHTVEKIFYPIEPAEKVISKKHIEKKNQNKQRTEKYTNLVNKADLNDLLTFKENSEIFISKSTLSPSVIKLIRGFVNHENPEAF